MLDGKCKEVEEFVEKSVAFFPQNIRNFLFDCVRDLERRLAPSSYVVPRQHQSSAFTGADACVGIVPALHI